jgi:hypothetical protein
MEQVDLVEVAQERIVVFVLPRDRDLVADRNLDQV